jgi:hypothetical protein
MVLSQANLSKSGLKCILTMFKREKGKIIQKHLDDSEGLLVKPTLFSDDKEFLRKFFVTLELSI